jgi:hypothetical protein
MTGEIESKKLRASKKFLAELPADVREWVALQLEREGMMRKNIRYTTIDTSWRTYAAEGCAYRVFLDGNEAGAQFDNQDSLHAGSDMRIGNSITLPFGAWMTEFRLFLGQPFFTIYCCVTETREQICAS